MSLLFQSFVCLKRAAVDCSILSSEQHMFTTRCLHQALAATVGLMDLKYHVCVLLDLMWGWPCWATAVAAAAAEYYAHETLDWTSTAHITTCGCCQRISLQRILPVTPTLTQHSSQVLTPG